MPVNYFDKASRFAATKLDPAGFLGWLLGLSPADFTFRGWLDTRGVPFPGDPDHTGDTVAHLENPAEHGVPWAVEFQIQPDSDMFGRLLGYLSGLWLNQRPDEERGSRFHVGAAVVNLTGNGDASRNLLWSAAGLTTYLGVIERNLERESAADLIAGIDAARWSRCLLPWVPLMAGGDDPALIDRWKVLAEAEANSRRRAEFARIAKVFAERVGRKAIWDEKLEGWNVEESTVVNEWISEAEARVLLRLGAQRFGEATEDTETAIRNIKERARMERMLDRILKATDWADLLSTP